MATPRIDLAELHRAWDQYRYPHDEVHRFDTRAEVARDLALDVLVFLPEAGDDTGRTWFATAGLSRLPHRSDVGRFELELAVRGWLSPDERNALARRFADLAIAPLRHDVVMRRDLLLDFALPGFVDRTAVIVTDVGWSTPEHLLGLPPKVRVLEVLTLHPRELAQLRRIGAAAARVQFLDAGVDLVDRRRAAVDLEPAEPHVRVRSEPMMQPNHDLKTIWADIDGWLAAKAPTTAASLGPGADPAAIAHAEEVVGHALPADVVASYQIHDGYAGLTDYEYISLEAALELWTAYRELPSWRAAWFPIASDSGGNLICAELATGRLVFWEQQEGPTPSDFESWGDWLAQFRDELLAGKYGTDDNGRLALPDPE